MAVKRNGTVCGRRGLGLYPIPVYILYLDSRNVCLAPMFFFLAVNEHTVTERHRRNSVHLPTVEYEAVCGRRGLLDSHVHCCGVCPGRRGGGVD